MSNALNRKVFVDTFFFTLFYFSGVLVIIKNIPSVEVVDTVKFMTQQSA